MGGGSYGVEGFGSTGILGDGSLVGVSGMASSASGTGLMGQCVMSTCNPLLLNNHSGTATFYVTDGGDIYAHGTLHAFLRTRDGNVAKTYAPTSTLPTIEDFGSGQIVNGAGIVHIDPSFANMSDEAGYQVFLTPQGDNHGLYVTQKTAATFAVRESMGGRSTLAFDYRIVARQNGHSGERAAIARTASDLGEPIRAIPHPQMLQAPKTPRAARTTADTHTVPDLARRLRNP